MTNDEIVLELHGVEGLLGISHYRGDRITADEMDRGRRVLAAARKALATRPDN